MVARPSATHWVFHCFFWCLRSSDGNAASHERQATTALPEELLFPLGVEQALTTQMKAGELATATRTFNYVLRPTPIGITKEVSMPQTYSKSEAEASHLLLHPSEN